MFKKLLQVVTAFSLLMAGYVGYVRGFAIVAVQLAPKERPKLTRWTRERSKTELEAIDLAIKAFGKDHWTADKELPQRYYNHERGYWIYSKSCEKSKDGKQLTMKPFALIWKSRGKPDELKIVTSDEAVIDLDRPLGLASSKQGSLRVVHARIQGNVRIRDNKGTLKNTADDLVMGPMPYLEYDEATLQVKSESDVVIKDRDMKITGFGLQIDLRPKNETGMPGGPSGFDGAKTAILRKNVHLIINNAGSTGSLTGSGKAKATTKGEKSNGPLDVRCAGPMQVDLPKPKEAVKVGPPAPASPTMVYFSRDVVVLQIKPAQLPDQLNCDNLRLTLVPASKPPAPASAAGQGQEQATGKDGAAEPKPALAKVEVKEQAKPQEGEALADADQEPSAEGGPGSELTLREAMATGHAVWLQSKSQGLTVRGNELIHSKLLSRGESDKTFIRSDPTSQLWIEKIDKYQDGPKKGEVQAVNVIRAPDATIFDDGKGTEYALVVTRGPGILETRPGRDQPVERRATWNDSLVMETNEGPRNLPQRVITLKGRPKLFDLKQETTLDARGTIVAFLKPKEVKADPAKPASTKAATGAEAPAAGPGGFQIDKLIALQDVNLKSPGKVMYGRDRLDVDFLAAPPLVTAQSPAQPAANATASTKPANAVASTNATPNGASEPKADAKAPEKPKDPDIRVRANRVWALIAQRSANGASPPKSDGTAGTGGADVKEVRLRGGVDFHQDPAPGKTQGTDVVGEALDLVNLGNGKSKFQVHDREDSASPYPNELAAAIPPAKVTTEDMTIVGPRISLDQSTDYATVIGPGSLLQMAERGLFTDKGLGEEKPAPKDPKAPSTKRPLKITWKKEMRFYGHSVNPNKEAVAKAEFYENVRATMEDAYLECEEKMEAFMDRTVVLARPKRDDKAKAEGEGNGETPAEPKPQIALIKCYKKVLVVTRKVDPTNPRLLLQQQQIEGEKLAYEKASGDFFVESAGRVHLWNREGEDETGTQPAAGAPGVARRTVTPTSNVVPSPRGAGEARAPQVVGRAGNPNQGPKAAARPGAKVKALAPLKLTVIEFSKSMKGRYIAGKDADKVEPRWADFEGDVQTLHAEVADEKVRLDFDRPPEDGMFLTSNTLRVISEPTLDPASPTRNFLKARENAQARTNTETIQGDVITYDSLKQLFYAYSDEGRDVVVVHTPGPGQIPSNTNARAVQVNRRTGESQLIDPEKFQLVDDKTGSRPGLVKEGAIKPYKPQRAPLRLPGRSVTERRGMNGR